MILKKETSKSIYENKTILIIGDNPSILKNKLGNEIDKFQIVARINNYKINNY